MSGLDLVRTSQAKLILSQVGQDQVRLQSTKVGSC